MYGEVDGAPEIGAGWSGEGSELTAEELVDGPVFFLAFGGTVGTAAAGFTL